MSDATRRRRQLLRKAESVFEDPDAKQALKAEGITVGGERALSREEIAALADDDPSDTRPSVTVTCYFDDTPVSDRAVVEDPLSDYVEDSEIGEWLGSGQGSVGNRAFFDVTFAVVNLAQALPLIKAKLLELGVGEKTKLEASDGSVTGVRQ